MALLSAVCMTFTACGDDDNSESNEQALQVSPNQISFTADGGEKTITVTTSKSWSVGNTPEWLTVTPNRGEGNSAIAVKASASGMAAERTAEFVVITASEQVTVSVSQQGGMLSRTIVGAWKLKNREQYFTFSQDNTCIETQLLNDEIVASDWYYVYDSDNGKLKLLYDKDLPDIVASEYSVMQATSSALVLKDEWNAEYVFERFTGNVPQPADYSAVIQRDWVNMNRFEYIYLRNGHDVYYRWTVSEMLNEENVAHGAFYEGSYTLNGKNLTLSINGSLELYDNIYNEWHGFTAGTWRELRFTVKSCTADQLVMTDADGNTQTYIPVEKYTPRIYGSKATGKQDGYEYVDLGLSVKWAIMNLGAICSQDYGEGSYAMGESGTADDPVKKEWGGQWRLPTLEEAKELVERCTITRIGDGDANFYSGDGLAVGYVVTGPNGNSIFLPGSGESVGTSYMVGKKTGETVLGRDRYYYIDLLMKRVDQGIAGGKIRPVIK